MEFTKRMRALRTAWNQEVASAQFEDLCQRFQSSYPSFIAEIRQKRDHYLAFLNYPTPFAAPGLRRYEDWTFRETEVRLQEHGELRRALGLRRVPDHTTLYRFLKRLEDQKIGQALGEAARRLGTGCGRRHARVAVDATGLAQGAVSTFFVRRMYHHTGQLLPWRHWLRWLVTMDVDRQVLLAQAARWGPGNNCANLPALMATAHQVQPIGLVLADAEFDSERNHIRQQLRAWSIVAPSGARRVGASTECAEMRRVFPRCQYARRALVETVFSTVKRKLSSRAPGRSLFMQLRQALLLGLAYNLHRL